jgi:DNA modification methylase
MTLLKGNCLDLLAKMPDNSVDSIVTDPPYGLEFMGKDWDAPWKGKASREFNQIEEGSLGGFTQLPNHSRVNNLKCLACDKWKFSSNPCKCAKPKFPNARLDAMVQFQLWCQEWASECLRVLKPGGHLLAFSGSRTYHRMTVAIEDAGFEIRDQIMWIYGSGFPKSLDVSKAIDKAAGAEREVLGNKSVGIKNGAAGGSHEYGLKATQVDITAPATPEAQRWQGWGTALKPAHEPIVVARKPLTGTVASNVLEWGTGALNIDGSRVGTADWGSRPPSSPNQIYGKLDLTDEPSIANALGRWPANVIHDGSEEVLEGFPTTGPSKSGGMGGQKPGEQIYELGIKKQPRGGHDDLGGSAARFFYCAKASKAERNAGLDGLSEKKVHRYGAGIGEGKTPEAPSIDRNFHPTVKPLALMRYLVKLVTPPNGTVLDPFLGSGTTAVASTLEGFQWIGCEMTEDYWPIIEARVAWAEKQQEGKLL